MKWKRLATWGDMTALTESLPRLVNEWQARKNLEGHYQKLRDVHLRELFAGDYQCDLNLPDIAEVWRRGSVIASWLIDLTAAAVLDDPLLAKFAGRVSDSGEGRWTIQAVIDEAVPAPVLTNALYERFASHGEADFADKLLSAMRYHFGGHLEKSTEQTGVVLPA